MLFVLMFLSLRSYAADTLFVSSRISDAELARMKGKSYPEGCPVPLSDLRYLRLSHWNAEGKTVTGELVCHKDIARDLLDIFRELWKMGYRIERMRLIDEYGAKDEASMEANNTSSFNFRYVTGTKVISKHGYGKAIDINPLYNPCVSTRKGVKRIEPASGKKYAYNRSEAKDERYQRYKLPRKVINLFKAHGFKWGGDWKTVKDYQHFEK